ncbi:MAG TPA: hypothetical protein VNT03_03790 [Baekduia sp.]|nr:hypothetical protein [Baekduia sp.]
MPLDPINPIGPRPAQQPGAIPAIRRPEGATDKRDRERRQQQRKRRESVPDLPSAHDDGRPHIDIRV